MSFLNTIKNSLTALGDAFKSKSLQKKTDEKVADYQAKKGVESKDTSIFSATATYSNSTKTQTTKNATEYTLTKEDKTLGDAINNAYESESQKLTDAQKATASQMMFDNFNEEQTKLFNESLVSTQINSYLEEQGLSKDSIKEEDYNKMVSDIAQDGKIDDSKAYKEIFGKNDHEYYILDDNVRAEDIPAAVLQNVDMTAFKGQSIVTDKLVNLTDYGTQGDNFKNGEMFEAKQKELTIPKGATAKEIKQAIIENYDIKTLDSAAGQQILASIYLNEGNGKIFDGDKFNNANDVIDVLAKRAEKKETNITTPDNQMSFVFKNRLNYTRNAATEYNPDVKMSFLNATQNSVAFSDLNSNYSLEDGGGVTMRALLDYVEYGEDENGKPTTFNQQLTNANLNRLQAEKELDEAKAAGKGVKQAEANLAKAQQDYADMSAMGVSAIKQIIETNADLFEANDVDSYYHQVFEQNAVEGAKNDTNVNNNNILYADLKIPKAILESEGDKDYSIKLENIAYLTNQKVSQPKAKTTKPAPTPQPQPQPQGEPSVIAGGPSESEVVLVEPFPEQTQAADGPRVINAGSPGRIVTSSGGGGGGSHRTENTPQPTTPQATTPTTPQATTPEESTTPTTPQATTPQATTPEATTPTPTKVDDDKPEPSTTPTNPDPTTSEKPDPTNPEPTNVDDNKPEPSTTPTNPEATTPEPPSNPTCDDNKDDVSGDRDKGENDPIKDNPRTETKDEDKNISDTNVGVDKNPSKPSGDSQKPESSGNDTPKDSQSENKTQTENKTQSDTGSQGDKGGQSDKGSQGEQSGSQSGSQSGNDNKSDSGSKQESSDKSSTSDNKSSGCDQQESVSGRTEGGAGDIGSARGGSDNDKDKDE